jgi:hypothetical protein
VREDSRRKLLVRGFAALAIGLAAFWVIDSRDSTTPIAITDSQRGAIPTPPLVGHGSRLPSSGSHRVIDGGLTQLPAVDGGNERLALITGHVVLQDGGAPGRPVTVVAEPRRLEDGRRVLSNSEGGFWIQVTPSTYRLSAYETKPAGWGARPRTVEAEPSETVTIDDLLLSDDGLGSISGIVGGLDGGAIFEAELDVDVRDEDRYDGFSEKDGSFGLDRVQPGAHLLLVAKKGYTPLSLPIALKPGQDLNVGRLSLKPVSTPPP